MNVNVVMWMKTCNSKNKLSNAAGTNSPSKQEFISCLCHMFIMGLVQLGSTHRPRLIKQLWDTAGLVIEE